MQKQLTPHKHAELIKFWADNPDTKFQVLYQITVFGKILVHQLGTWIMNTELNQNLN